MHVHKTDVETRANKQTAEPVIECDCEMIIGKSGRWMDSELAMSRPSSLILCDGFFFFF